MGRLVVFDSSPFLSSAEAPLFSLLDLFVDLMAMLDPRYTTHSNARRPRGRHAKRGEIRSPTRPCRRCEVKEKGHLGAQRSIRSAGRSGSLGKDPRAAEILSPRRHATAR